MSRCFLLILILLLSSCFSERNRGQLNVAVASNFFAPMHALTDQFTKDTGIEVALSAGATGQLFTQIKQGAPFDVFFAADEARPLALVEQGMAIPQSRFTYVEGRLVLWSLAPLNSEDLKTLSFQHVAIANPKLAPYGVAAIEAMKHLGVYQNWQNKLVMGQNIAQAQQFVVAGQADAAIISLSQAKLWGSHGTQKAYHQLLPNDSHAPIVQQAVQISKHKDAENFMAFIRSSKVKQQLQSWGYEVGL